MTDDMRDEEVASMLQAARADRFAPGFADRVMARMDARGAAPVLRLERSLGRTFLWVAPVAIAATLVLAVLNMRSTGASGLDGALGLPKVTLSAVYSLDSDVTASQ
jgi:hypothetical protein